LYSIAGLIMCAGTYCAQTACTGLTSEEISYLLNGPDYHGSDNAPMMERWPRREKYAYFDDYDRDDDDEIIFDENVKILKSIVPRDHDGPISVFLDDGSFEDGAYCDACCAELIEPYIITCGICGGRALTGEFALKAENEFKQFACKNCIETHTRTLLDALATQWQEEAAHSADEEQRACYELYQEKALASTSLREYWGDIEIQASAYQTGKVPVNKVEALQTVHKITSELLTNWQETFDFTAEEFERLSEKYQEE